MTRTRESFFFKQGHTLFDWYVFEPKEEEELEGYPEAQEVGGWWKKPETEEEWKEAVLLSNYDGELDGIEEFDFKETGITRELIEFLDSAEYFVEINVERDEPEPLTVSKMGRKKIINIPPKSQIEKGDKVRILKTNYPESDKEETK